MDLSVLAAILILIGFVVGLIWSYRHEKRLWNNGACSCGKGFWKSFDVDSSGAVGYRCSECHKYIWISWGIITS